jgi:chromosome segregation ATPase
MDDDGIASREHRGEAPHEGGGPPDQALTRELVQQFVERNRRIETLEHRLDELTHTLEQQREAHRDRDAELAAVQADLQARDAELAALEAELVERTAALASAESELQRRETALSAARIQVQHRDDQLARAEARVAEIKRSRVWHLAQVYWHLRRWLAGRPRQPRR